MVASIATGQIVNPSFHLNIKLPIASINSFILCCSFARKKMNWPTKQYFKAEELIMFNQVKIAINWMLQILLFLIKSS